MQGLVAVVSPIQARVCRDNKAEGKELLLASLHAFPCNWAAWLALAALRGSAELDADAALPATGCAASSWRMSAWRARRMRRPWADCRYKTRLSARSPIWHGGASLLRNR